MTSGDIEFYVDNSGVWQLCPDTNGVGSSGKGGVFNCGLTGSKFSIDCDNC